MPDARAAILDRIRSQLGPSHGASPIARTHRYESIPRLYTQAGSRTRQASIDLLLDRLNDYDAEVITLDHAAIGATVGAVLKRNQESILLVPASIPPSWLPAEIEVLHDADLTHATLTRAQAVLTPCACAIAETGTILLVHGPEQGTRAATLLPDHHICVLRTDQVVETVSEGLARLSAQKTLPITTISGPSATADIEMTRIRGVHGPRRLTVLLISDQRLHELA